MSVKQDRAVARTPADLERKYNFGKSFAEVLGICKDTRDHVDIVESELRAADEEQSTSISRNSEAIKAQAETIEANDRKTESQVTMLSDKISVSISTTTENIMNALNDYTLNEDFEKYQSTVSTELQILSDEILLKFTESANVVQSVNGDMQSKFTEIYKYISFEGGSITLGSSENAVTLTVENDNIVFKKGGAVFGSWDGNNFYAGNIVIRVNERAQLGNFAFIPRSNGSLSFVKVGG